MASVERHYEEVLADVYAWMYGGFDAALARNASFFARHGIRPSGSALAIDLGAGCGFQSLPLADLGFEVVAIDSSRKLLAELERRAAGKRVTIIHGDLQSFERHAPADAEIVVCMVDTLLHLPSQAAVAELLPKVYSALRDGGRFIVSFRDFTAEQKELDRFIPVRNDDTTIFTCFLEYEPSTVKVHDLVYRNEAGRWQFYKSFYRKLRLAPSWFESELERAGFRARESETERGFVTTIATK